jgi:O-antigen/teichoic acid export membrane protein
VLPLILLAALIPAMKGFINPMIVNFYKDLKFDQEFKFRTILLAADLVVSLSVAVATRSALAFIAALFVGGVLEVILSFLWCTVWPKFRYTKTYLAEIVGYGKWITLAGAGHWFSSQLGDFVTGKLFGTASLGIYQAAYKVSTLPVTEISGTVNQVAFPVMSKVKADKERLIKIFSSTFLSTNTIGIGIAVVIFLFPELVVSIVLGPQWTAAASILRLLAVFGVLRTIESSLQPLFLAVGKPNVPSIGNLIKVVVLAVGLFLWAPQGLIGVSFAAVVSAIAVMPYYILSVLPVLSR